jgi:hypothetical protein
MTAVADDIAFFTHQGDTLVPTPLACSMWSDDQMHGVALSGALARAAEACLATAGRTDLRPARWTVDLFKPARMVPCSFATEVVREGSRICLVDVTMTQEGRRVARASPSHLPDSHSPPEVLCEAQAARAKNSEVRRVERMPTTVSKGHTSLRGSGIAGVGAAG